MPKRSGGPSTTPRVVERLLPSACVVRPTAAAQRDAADANARTDAAVATAAAAAHSACHAGSTSTPGSHLVLLAQTRRGYGNLAHWITLARRRAAKGEYLALTSDLELSALASAMTSSSVGILYWPLN